MPHRRPLFDATNGTTISGTTEGGATVDIDIDGDGTFDDSVTADDEGNFEYTPETPIEDGTTVTATATDDAGNTSDTATQVVDASSSTPLIDEVQDDQGAITGFIADGGVTDDSIPSISGSDAEGGALISVYDGGTLLGTTTADDGGNWFFEPGAPLADGEHGFIVTAEDALGNVSAASPPYIINVDTMAPSAPQIDPTDGSQVTGNAEAGTTVALDTDGDGETDATTTADASGNFTYTPVTPIPDGTTISATATDAAGNVSAPDMETVDTDGGAAAPQTPDMPTIETITDDVAALTGLIAEGGATNDTRPTIAGTSDANVMISVFDGDMLIGTVAADASGNWQLTPGNPLSDGSHGLTAVATNAASVSSNPSAAFIVVVDTLAPGAPVISQTDGTVVSGTAEPGTRVNLDLDNDATSDATVVADASGNFTYTPVTPIPDGTTISATATDAAGNVSASDMETVDTGAGSALAAPTIDAVFDDVAPDTGSVSDGGTTDDAVPGIAGTAAAGAMISIYDGATLLGTTTANGSGDWTFTPAAALAEGAHSFTATASDGSGNTSAPSADYDITVDTASNPDPSAPIAMIEITAITEDTGTPGDFQTEDTTPLVSGTLSEALDPGERVEVQIDGGTWMDAAVDGTSWQYDPGTLAEGNHTIGARVIGPTDLTGDSDTQPVVILPEAMPPQNAPIALARNEDLVGIVSAEVIDLVDFNDQALTAVDADNNLASVVVAFNPLLNVDLDAYDLTASSSLADSLGLTFTVDNDPGILGILAPIFRSHHHRDRRRRDRQCRNQPIAVDGSL